MKFWQQVFPQVFSMKFTIFKWLITLVLVLTLTSCGEKAGSQEIPVSQKNNPPKISQISQQFSEVSPPEAIQQLRLALENYRPQVKILSPQPDQILQDNQVTVSFQVKDIPIFKDPELELGPHLHVIVDNQPYIAVYDVNKPLTLPELSPGTHTLRVFASRPWHESFKNEGAYAQTTFHLFTKTEDNNPDPALPILTYSRPKGSYGAEPILLDFYLTNAPLHLVAEDKPNDTISDWRIRCTINGESFILDRWQPIYLKGFKPGNNWLKLEFLDNQGNPLKNAFNTTARLINYQPNGKDTLSRIVRGELSADQARSIVDQNYTTKKPEPTVTPSLETKPSPQPIPQTQIPETPPTESPEIPEPETVAEPETPKSKGSLQPPSVPTTAPLPETIQSPDVTPTDEVEKPEKVTEPATPKSSKSAAPAEEAEVSPTGESKTLPAKIAPDSQNQGLKKLQKYFQPRKLENDQPSPIDSPVVPETTPIPEPEEKAGEYKVTNFDQS
ncbi:hypothetical protein VB620_17690 [Nodularia harveyana UHCC-0300]|uniref:FHA domain containing protein n=1 Tax=Nodularia harveyana UHCC-0300 TaxID=2974287 RepID=A0ABU5UHY4_9CYAN|nr:hypothetical protein [Nodularia harveyana]MEA5583167.1 hypothetical protein [Nodularia harveyana UHCC-0300]